MRLSAGFDSRAGRDTLEVMAITRVVVMVVFSEREHRRGSLHSAAAVGPGAGPVGLERV